jgi:hypothetical protein
MRPGRRMTASSKRCPRNPVEFQLPRWCDRGQVLVLRQRLTAPNRTPGRGGSNLSVVMQAADLPESPLAAAAALPCGRSCWLPGWCTRVLRQVWQAKECASTLARYCGCQLVCICRSLIAAFRCAGVISFSKPFLASLKVVSPAKGPLEQARLVPAIRTSDAAAIIGLNMTPIKEGEIVQLLSVWWHLRITAVAPCRP